MTRRERERSAAVFANLDADHDDRTGRLVAVGALGAGEGATHLAAHLGVVGRAGRAALPAGRRRSRDGGPCRGRRASRALPASSTCSTARPILARCWPGDRPAISTCSRWVRGRSGTRGFPTWRSWGEMFVDLRESYDYVFVDLPPLAETPEVKSILRRTDALLLATAWGPDPAQADADLPGKRPRSPAERLRRRPDACPRRASAALWRARALWRVADRQKARKVVLACQKPRGHGLGVAGDRPPAEDRTIGPGAKGREIGREPRRDRPSDRRLSR